MVVKVEDGDGGGKGLVMRRCAIQSFYFFFQYFYCNIVIQK